MSASEHTEELLLAHVLGILPAGDRNRVELHVGHCSRCAAALAQARDDAAQLAMALPPQPVAPLVREQLVHALGEVSRFVDVAAAAGEALALPPAAIEKLFDAIDHPAAWTDTENGTQWLAAPSAHPGTGLVRVPAGHTATALGVKFGPHALILQGTCHTAFGETRRAGDRLLLGDRDDESCTALAGPDLICLCGAGRPAPSARRGAAGGGPQAPR